LHAAPARIAVLAARHPATPVENPAQVSAFRYPREYGPASPSFSRASLLRTHAGDLLFVSGTAAITGHVSLHPGDAAAQLRASLANIEIVLATAVGVQGLFSAQPGVQPSAALLPAAQLRVYVRMPQDLPALRSAFAAQVQLPCSVEWLHADVCRRELLVEVEAAFSLPAGWPTGALPAVPGE
jgi:chorismate lyase/3-hydroxybenzoate synthase